MLLIPTYMAHNYNFDINDNFFSVEYSKKKNVKRINDWTAFAIITMLKDTDNLAKYKLINQYVLTNRFYNDIEKEAFFECFCRAQKHLMCLTRFVNRIKFNLLEIYACDTDMN